MPHLAGQSRIFTSCHASREMRQICPAFFLNGGYYLFALPIILHFCLGTQQSENKARFILRTPTDAVFHAWQPSPVTVYFVTPPAASTLLYRDVPLVMDSHWIIASVLRVTCALFSIFSGYEMAEA